MDTFHQIVGKSAENILWWQMICRGILIFFYTLFLVRFGGRRIFGKTTSFDIVLGVILGSTLSRALTANASFFPTLAVTAVLVVLHRMLGTLARHSQTVANLIKGTEVRLVEDGKIREEDLKKANLTVHDLMECLRLNGGTMNVEDVKAAFLERSGDVSVVSR